MIMGQKFFFFSIPGNFGRNWAGLPDEAGDQAIVQNDNGTRRNMLKFTVHLSVHSGVYNYCLMHIDQRKPMSDLVRVLRLHQRPRASERASE